jgi:putative nucleotidyltransferase with HDIG domain
MTSKKKIGVRSLRVGMYLSSMEVAWFDHPFLRSEFPIATDRDVQLVRDTGVMHVWIDTTLGCDEFDPHEPASAKPESVAPVQASTPQPTRLPLHEEMTAAKRICAQGREHVVAMFREARLGKIVDRQAIEPFLEEVAASIDRNPSALLTLARLKKANDYTYMHSVAVCALMTALAKALGLGRAEARDAGFGGLLHDVGKAMIPDSILNKPGKLTDEEFAVIKMHPSIGHRILRDAGGCGEVAHDVCLHHHEKVDGSGYPEGIAGDQLSLHARMGAVCDIYDAITSNRPYKAGWDPGEAIRAMTGLCDGHLDKSVFYAFAKCVGIYPVGSLVRLASGHLGIVVEQSAESLITPEVRIFYSIKSGEPIIPRRVDLATAGAKYQISGSEDPSVWGLSNLDKYLTH